AVRVPRRIVVRKSRRELAARRRVVGVDAVVAVVVGRQIVAPVAVDAGPVERVGRAGLVVLAGHVLDPGVVDTVHPHTRAGDLLALQDDTIAVHAADVQAVGQTMGGVNGR